MSDDAELTEDEFAIVLRTGRRYTLGIRDERYVIWHLQGGGEAVASFDGNEEGHEQAEGEFRRLEREARGGSTWWRFLRPAFLAALAVWVLSGIATAGWYVATAIDGSFGSGFSSWILTAQGVHTGSFVVWVGALALLGFRWVSSAIEPGDPTRV